MLKKMLQVLKTKVSKSAQHLGRGFSLSVNENFLKDLDE